MIQVHHAIRRVTLGVTLSWTAHLVLAALVLGATVLASITGLPPALLAAIPCTIWVVLAINGAKETRSAMGWTALIAAGHLDEAERQIERTIRSFSLIRSVKLLSLHQLAVVRMAQRKWAEAAELSRAMLSFRMGRDRSLAKASLLVLGAAAVRLNDLNQAHAALAQIRSLPLTLDEQLALLACECAYLAKAGHFRELTGGLDEKARLAELMSTETAAQTQAFLALAARRCGRDDWHGYLKRRCELLTDPALLVREEPLFRELWDTTTH